MPDRMPLPAISVQKEIPNLRFAALRPEDLDAVLSIEMQSYSHPWSRGNFNDCLKVGFHAQGVFSEDQLLAYSVSMLGYEEVHLLNITVTPAMRSKGLAMLLLEMLAAWSAGQNARCIWLEVRASHERTKRLYIRNGFEEVAVRKAYYPFNDSEREDAIVMRRVLDCTSAASLTIQENGSVA